MPESCRLWHSKPHYYYYTLLVLLTSPLLAVAVATMAAEAAEGVTTTDSAITSSRRSQAIARHDEFPVIDVAVGERIGSANVMFSLKHLKSRHPRSKSKQSVRTYVRTHAYMHTSALSCIKMDTMEMCVRIKKRTTAVARQMYVCMHLSMRMDICVLENSVVWTNSLQNWHNRRVAPLSLIYIQLSASRQNSKAAWGRKRSRAPLFGWFLPVIANPSQSQKHGPMVHFG